MAPGVIELRSDAAMPNGSIPAALEQSE